MMRYYRQKGYFLAKNDQKLPTHHIIRSKITVFCMPTYEIMLYKYPTLVIWYGFYCKIGEVQVDLLPFLQV